MPAAPADDRNWALLDALSDMSSSLENCATLALHLGITVEVYEDFGIAPERARELRHLVEHIDAFLAVCPVRFEEAGTVYPPGTRVRPDDPPR